MSNESQAVQQPLSQKKLSQEELLRKWLSVTESQISALEVLSEQMPKVNHLLETDMTELSIQFGNMTFHMQELQKHIEALKEQAVDHDQAGELPRHIEEEFEKISHAIGQTIICMQFQDRVSQNIVINVEVMQQIVIFLQNIIDLTLDNFEHEYQQKSQHERRRVKLDQALVEQLLDRLKLGELQNSFVDHLLKHGYIEDPAEIGHTMTDSTDDNVDLF